jgi:sugar phosphate permease
MALLERGFSFRASTAFLSLAVGALAGGLIAGWFGDRLSSSGASLVSGVLVMAAFPTLALCSSLASLGYLLVRRRLQHLVELAVSLGLLAWLSTWESL